MNNYEVHLHVPRIGPVTIQITAGSMDQARNAAKASYPPGTRVTSVTKVQSAR